MPETFAAQLPQIKEVLRKLAGKLEIKNADERKQVRTRQAVLHSEEFKACGTASSTKPPIEWSSTTKN